MNLKILFMILMYYSVLSIFFLFAGAETHMFDDTNFTNPLNDSDLQAEETDTGGLFSTGISFGRYFVFIATGFGLPDGTPSWFQLIFSTWNIAFAVFTVGFILASIWNG